MNLDLIHGDVLRPEYAWLGVGAACQVVDPPYSAKVHRNAVSTRTGGVGVRKRDFGFPSLSPELALRIASYAAQVRRWTIVFSDFEGAGLWREAMSWHGVEFVRSVPWIRWSQPQVTGDRPGSGREEVMFFHAPRRRGDPNRESRLRWNGDGGLVAFTAKSLRGKDKHPTEKPLDLMLQIVSYVSDPGELIIDPCAGRGTTGLAARLLGRGFVGAEQNLAESEKGETRLYGDLSARDAERLGRFAKAQYEEASLVPAPKCPKGSDVKTWERAQRRLQDVERVLKHV